MQARMPAVTALIMIVVRISSPPGGSRLWIRLLVWLAPEPEKKHGRKGASCWANSHAWLIPEELRVGGRKLASRRALRQAVEPPAFDRRGQAIQEALDIGAASRLPHGINAHAVQLHRRKLLSGRGHCQTAEKSNSDEGALHASPLAIGGGRWLGLARSLARLSQYAFVIHVAAGAPQLDLRAEHPDLPASLAASAVPADLVSLDPPRAGP